MAKSLILKKLADYLELSLSALEREVGLSNGVIIKSIDRNADISLLIKEKLSKKYPDINLNWLETGKGEIFTIKKGDDKEVITLGKHLPVKGENSDWQGLPMYNAPITASFVESYRDDAFYTPQYYLHDPRFRDCNFGAIITGDSMHAEIRHGDYVACKEITDWKFVVFGDIYYVVASNGLETCKYLNADPHDSGNFLLVPRNESISPSPIPKEMIHKLYRVRGIVRGY